MPVPLPRPIFVRPAQAPRKIRLAALPDFVHRTLQHLPPVEPVVVVAKSVDAIARGQFRLRRARFRQAQIVETQISRQVRLIMTREKRLRPHHVRPFREPFPPPLVVLGNGMKLRQVKGDRPDAGLPAAMCPPFELAGITRSLIASLLSAHVESRTVWASTGLPFARKMSADLAGTQHIGARQMLSGTATPAVARYSMMWKPAEASSAFALSAVNHLR